MGFIPSQPCLVPFLHAFMCIVYSLNFIYFCIFRSLNIFAMHKLYTYLSFTITLFILSLSSICSCSTFLSQHEVECLVCIWYVSFYLLVDCVTLHIKQFSLCQFLQECIVENFTGLFRVCESNPICQLHYVHISVNGSNSISTITTLFYVMLYYKK